MEYLTYTEYEERGGAEVQPKFNLNYRQAKRYIDYFTFNRLVNDDEFSDNIKDACFFIIKKMEQRSLAEDDAGRVVDTQTNDGFTVRYHVSADLVKGKTLEEQIRVIIKTFLEGERNQNGERLLNRGVQP